jgi:hypothetical protein
MEESIYQLIPPEVIPIKKPAMYHSRFPGVIAPTGSTFNNHTTINNKVTPTFHSDQQCERFLRCAVDPIQLQGLAIDDRSSEEYHIQCERKVPDSRVNNWNCYP